GLANHEDGREDELLEGGGGAAEVDGLAAAAGDHRRPHPGPDAQGVTQGLAVLAPAGEGALVEGGEDGGVADPGGLGEGAGGLAGLAQVLGEDVLDTAREAAAAAATAAAAAGRDRLNGIVLDPHQRVLRRILV